MPALNFFNSKEVEWKDLSAVIGGAVCAKLTGLKYSVKNEKEHLYAAGNEPISIQSGNKSYQGEVSLLKGALDDMNRAAVSAGGDDITDVRVDIVAAYRAKGTRALQTDTLVSLEFSEFEKAMKQGDKKMEVTMPFLCLSIKST